MRGACMPGADGILARFNRDLKAREPVKRRLRDTARIPRTSTHTPTHEGNSPGRRLWQPTLSGHARRIEAAAARLRQADDLLPPDDVDAVRNTRGAHYLDTRGHAA